MASKTFSKSVQKAVATALPGWDFVDRDSDSVFQAFARALGDSRVPLKQQIDFQKGSGEWFSVNFAMTYDGVGKGGDPASYTVCAWDRMDIALDGHVVEECVLESADYITLAANQCAEEYRPAMPDINRVMQAMLPEYAQWRQQMPPEFTNLQTYLASRLSAERMHARLGGNKHCSTSASLASPELQADFRSWFKNTEKSQAGLSAFFAATPDAAQLLMPFPDDVINGARFEDFHQHLLDRGYLNSNHADMFLRSFWNYGRPRLQTDFNEDKHSGNDCFT